MCISIIYQYTVCKHPRPHQSSSRKCCRAYPKCRLSNGTVQLRGRCERCQQRANEADKWPGTGTVKWDLPMDWDGGSWTGPKIDGEIAPEDMRGVERKVVAVKMDSDIANEDTKGVKRKVEEGKVDANQGSGGESPFIPFGKRMRMLYYP